MNQLSVGELTAFYTYSMLFAWPLRRIGQIVSEMGMASVAIKRLFSIHNTDTEDYSGENYEDHKIFYINIFCIYIRHYSFISALNIEALRLKD